MPDNPKPVPQRQDPAAARQVKAYRLHPDTIRAIIARAKVEHLSQGQAVDAFVGAHVPKDTP